MRDYEADSRVEEVVLEKYGKPLFYPPTERIGVVEVADFPTLGKLAALRFLEWLQLNPEGVVSLPTGKTPEHFIKWTLHYLKDWERKEVQRELASWGLDPGQRPIMGSFRLVQIDEFYPMDPEHENSFANYIRRFYFEGFGLDPTRALLMDTWRVGAPTDKNLDWVYPGGRVDLSLRFRSPANELERHQARAIAAADQSSMEYEAKVENLGGIGFFLGGIGPDGHIGFNIRGSDHFCTTRLSPINYETAAAAAVDLGGIEIARRKVVMTIGLRTITQNPTVTAVVIAAGESKAGVVKDAVESRPSVLCPGTALHRCAGGRFYLTRGAASVLTERRYHELKTQAEIPGPSAERLLINLACRRKKRLIDFRPDDLAEDRLGEFLPNDRAALAELAERVAGDLKDRVARGVEDIDGATFLHTAPHHDDIMLGYFPYLTHLVRSPSNSHFSATFTSGFTSVTNAYILSILDILESCISRGVLEPRDEQGYFDPGNVSGRTRDIYQYLDGVAANSLEMQHEAETRRMLRNLAEIIGKQDLDSLRVEAAKTKEHLKSRYPGQKDVPSIQALKGMVREWEEELLWGHLGLNSDQVFHLRLGFYTGDIFTPQPEWERDVRPILDLLQKVSPDIVTVAMDPEGSGPDTHYKVLQALSEALQAYLGSSPRKTVQVWGYRNVWHRFHPAEANIYVPVSMNSLATLRAAFKICFGSQRNASFPSYEYDGPFSDLAQKIMVDQYAAIKTCLGRDFFYSNPSPRLRATRGLNFLRAMTPEEFFREARALKKRAEA